MDHRAYPGSEFVEANTLAKWKKFEPNEIDFSQGFSQKGVSRNCSAFNSLPASGNFCHLLITFAKSLDQDQVQQNVFLVYCDGWAALPHGATGCLQFVIVVFPDHTHLLFLIWIQTVWHPDGIEKIQHLKSKIWHNK